MNSPTTARELEALFSGPVCCVELSGQGDESLLFPQEADAIRTAVARRRQEFASGRTCARTALSHLGVRRGPIPIGTDRAPMWPAGALGSISHTGDYCVAVAGLTEDWSGLGIDAEIVAEVSPDLWRTVLCPSEIETLKAFGPAQGRRLAAVIFSAKEAFFKCQFPAARRWLDFTDVDVVPGDGDFVLRVRPEFAHPLAPNSASGRFILKDGLVITAVGVRNSC